MKNEKNIGEVYTLKKGKIMLYSFIRENVMCTGQNNKQKK